MEPKPQLDPKTNKTLYYLLTFGRSKESLPTTPDGFYNLDNLLQSPLFKPKKPTPNEIVASDLASLYELKTENEAHYIRIKQNSPVNNNPLSSSEIPLCIYRTNVDTWKHIKKEGIKAISGDFIPFITSYETPSHALLDTLIEINAQKAIEDGMEFYKGEDGVIYSKGKNGEIPAEYFVKASITIKGKLQEVDIKEREKKEGASYKEQKEKEKELEKQRQEEEIMGFAVDDIKGNHFKYICVLDFEAQCDENEKLKVQEIIEFPVVVIDVEQREIVETFHHYIKPTSYPQLFPFCTDLTGITQDKVENAKTLPEVLEELGQFLEEKEILKGSFCFMTCGDWDLAICLRKETQIKSLPVKSYLKRWINIKKVYPMPPDCAEKKYGMVGLLKLSHLELIGRHHSGIDDAMNIARVAIYLLKKDFKFVKSMVNSVTY